MLHVRKWLLHDCWKYEDIHWHNNDASRAKHVLRTGVLLDAEGWSYSVSESEGDVPAHHDRDLETGTQLDGWVSLLYLGGNGTFVYGAEVKEEVRISPGLLLRFRNDQPHAIKAGSEKRCFVGPFDSDWRLGVGGQHGDCVCTASQP